MTQLEFTIADPLGIHARPAGQLCKAVSTMDSSVRLTVGSKEADARRIMSVMGLGIKGGTTVRFTLDGPNAEADAQKLASILQEIGLI